MKLKSMSEASIDQDLAQEIEDQRKYDPDSEEEKNEEDDLGVEEQSNENG